ncbi:YqzL family protein [Natribacillus halophilus]|uniref:YqzL-like protein n=1 Tax=Natribacillus halophilus TaxID=549003 RepID=A0A1G8JRL9_9BACI|nr:YqzL family protein [Natribacillus halophilus]SDI33929.1 YqzL-like protein [Natribacillus halophilus]
MLNYWKLFALTGDLDAYLLHKEFERDDEWVEPAEEEAASTRHYDE